MKKVLILTALYSLIVFSTVSFAGNAIYYPANGVVEIPQLTLEGDAQGTVFSVNLQQRADTMTFDLSSAGTVAPSIVGSWGTGYEPGEENPEDGQASILVFYPNGYYFHYETGQDSEPCDLGGGAEFGSYTYDSSALKLRIDPLVDNNGCVGLSENGVPGTISGVSIKNDTLLFEDSVPKPLVQN